jgi:hypothetical protein
MGSILNLYGSERKNPWIKGPIRIREWDAWQELDGKWRQSTGLRSFALGPVSRRGSPGGRELYPTLLFSTFLYFSLLYRRLSEPCATVKPLRSLDSRNAFELTNQLESMFKASPQFPRFRRARVFSNAVELFASIGVNVLVPCCGSQSSSGSVARLATDSRSGRASIAHWDFDSFFFRCLAGVVIAGVDVASYTDARVIGQHSVQPASAIFGSVGHGNLASVE